MANILASPVFIGGCDRSGTTLLGAILGSHQNIVCIPEAQFILDGYLSLGDNRKANDLSSREILAKIEDHSRFKLWNIELKEYPKTRATYAEIIAFVIGEYADQNKARDSMLWVDHVPSNIKYTARLVELFPRAKFIHLVRDGRAVASSLLSVSWGPRTIDQAANFWVKSIAYGLAAEGFLGETQIIQVRYEDILTNPDVEIRRICKFLGIRFDLEMLKANGLNLPKYAQKDHQLVGQPLDTARISAWESKLNPRQIQIFESFTGDMLEYFDYRLKFGGRRMNLRMSERVHSLLGQIIEYLFVYFNQFRMRFLKR